MQLGMPFEPYILIFEGSIWASVIAQQCDRRVRASWYGKATLEGSSKAWAVLNSLTMATWPALIILAFLQFHWLTAIGWLALGGFTGAIIPALLGLYRRDVDQLLKAQRLAELAAVAGAATLWVQALT